MSRPPECDAACRAKIILNSGRVMREVSSVLELSAHMQSIGKFTDKEGQQLIDILDEVEDKLIEFNDRLLGKTGYKRKTKSLN
jgi:succinate dehydrogenase flavin-adding protein (antitoxin of CptAB toxin-antitoxin module)